MTGGTIHQYNLFAITTTYEGHRILLGLFPSRRDAEKYAAKLAADAGYCTAEEAGHRIERVRVDVYMKGV